MTSQEENLLIGEARRLMLERGLPIEVADVNIMSIVQKVVACHISLPGGLIVMLPSVEGVTPFVSYEKQAVLLRLFYGGAIHDTWHCIPIPRDEVDAVTPPPTPPFANGNVRMLADGTTGLPLPALTGRPQGTQAEPTIRDQAEKWFEANAKNYSLGKRSEKTKMYNDAASALNIGHGTAKTYLSQLVNGKR